MKRSTLAGPTREFQVFAKPGGAVCNLDCHYCYYLEKESLYPERRSFRMDDDILETFVLQQIDASLGEAVRFSWHGGEPTLLGLEYFRKIVALQRKYLPPDRELRNGIVTNGTLLNKEWCEFLSGEGFAVGLSLDGPAHLHDAHRVSKQGKETHDAVLRAFGLLRHHGVPCDILCVVHDRNVLCPEEVYAFFKQIGATYVGFLPLVIRGLAGVGKHTVAAADYGEFLCTIFDEWVSNDIGRLLIQNFDEAARPVRNLEHSLCVFRETCGDIPVLEHNGDLYSCDHFVDSEHLLGNITKQSLQTLLLGAEHTLFGEEKRETLPRHCLECDVLPMCNGGCPKDRFMQAQNGEPGLNYLCTGFKQFFAHCRPVFESLVPLWRSGATPEQLMAAARGRGRTTNVTVGRNDLCPCGSGKKYKRCCLDSGNQATGDKE